MRRKLRGSLLISVLLALTLCAGNTTVLAAGEGGETLTLMCVATEADPYYQAYKDIAARFSENNDYGVTIEVEAYENEQHKTKLTTLMASDAAPDIFYTYELAFLEPFVNGGKVIDITSYLDNDPDWKATFAEGTLDVLSYDGKNYGIPTESVLGVMFYNKQIFEENGVEVPKTYDEFLTLCQTLKDNGVIPMTLSGTDAWIPAQFVQQISAGMSGDEMFRAICDGTEAWNNEINVKAAEEVFKMAEAGYFQDGFLGMVPEESTALFTSGKAAMYYQGTWDTGLVQECEIGDVAGAFIMPAYDPQYSNYAVGSVDGSFALSNNCKNVDAAMAFLKFWSSTEIEEMLLYDYAKAPSTNNVVIDETKLSPVMKEVVECGKSVAGLMPWWDRQFGAGEGVEFNNTCVAILGGEDAQTAFDELQQFAEDYRDR